jgi:hypothetical protein
MRRVRFGVLFCRRGVLTPRVAGLNRTRQPRGEGTPPTIVYRCCGPRLFRAEAEFGRGPEFGPGA